MSEIIIRTVPVPDCPECGAPMKLKRPPEGATWRPFWGCRRWPACEGKREILPDGRPAEEDLDDYLTDDWDDPDD